jgi:hypothetical protein
LLNSLSAISEQAAEIIKAGRQPTIADRTAEAKLNQRGPEKKIMDDVNNQPAATSFSANA